MYLEPFKTQTENFAVSLPLKGCFRCHRHRVASSGRRVAPPWPRRIACLASRGWQEQIQCRCRVGLSSELFQPRKSLIEIEAAFFCRCTNRYLSICNSYHSLKLMVFNIVQLLHNMLVSKYEKILHGTI